jgi:hypothetical protein
MKRVDGLDAAIGISDNSNTSLNGRISTITRSVSDLEGKVKILDTTVNDSNSGLSNKVNNLVKIVGANEDDGLRKSVNELNATLKTAQDDVDELNATLKEARDEVNEFKAKDPLIIRDNILNKAAQTALSENFDVSGNQHIYISPKTGKTFYCSVSFILDPKCEFIGHSNISTRKDNINSAIKQTIPPYLFTDTYKEDPTWPSINDANADTSAYVVYNRKFSNITIDGLSMGVKKDSKNCIY